ncbi:MAG: hypothetical protein QF824_01870 [Candidatus Woesearchaeota archaeon]|jgi:hypothetical protein|nr:hypothetical protein [Candidatus Woesearchaeota archaeon]|tara:strand:+ start:515 stop:637 length:123 start_codon:yes stop_codon:yes gene_type:complete
MTSLINLYDGKVFYPPNNSTLGHAALVLPKMEDMDRNIGE